MPGVQDVTQHGLSEGSERVYIAGPYTHGTWEENIRQVIEAGQEVLESGHYPFLPHVHTYPWALFYPDNRWIEMDLVWLEICDSLIRLPGKSSGADSEVEFARENNIKVYYSVKEFKEERNA